MKKTILFMVNGKDTLSGGQSMVLNILKNIDRSKINPILVIQEECPLSIETKKLNIEVIINKQPSLFVRVSSIRFNKIRNILYLLVGLFQSKKYIKGIANVDFDGIWCENFTMLLLSHKLSTKNNFLVYNMWSNVNNSLGLRVIDRLSDYVIVEADFQMKKFNNVGRKSNIIKITTQIDEFVITDNYTRQFSREKQGICDLDTIVIGYLGGARYSKGYDIFIETADILLRSNEKKNIMFLLAGVKESDDMLIDKNCAKKITGFGRNIKILNWIEDKEQFYKSIDIFLSCSRNEGLPGTVRESMLFKNLVLGTDVGGTRELIKNDDQLILKDDDNTMAKEFSSKIIEFSSNKNLMKNRIEKSYSYAVSNYVGSRWVKELEDVLYNLDD